MKGIQKKLYKIEMIWQHILDHKYYNDGLAITEGVKSKLNHVGIILGYFSDTLEIVVEKQRLRTDLDRFAYQISLLQAIYVQQDCVEELLRVFRCGVTKGDLKLDINYSVNRELRNELVGHPIRISSGVLISATTLSYMQPKESIVYARYHQDNDYKFESKSFKISEIIKRHYLFLDTYLDKILDQLEILTKGFIENLQILELLIKNKKKIEIIIRVAELKLESVFDLCPIYDKNSILNIHQRIDEHFRYKNFINMFYKDLEEHLQGVKSTIKDIFDAPYFSSIEAEEMDIEKLDIRIMQLNNLNEAELADLLKKREQTKEYYHYELGKLCNKGTLDTFEMYAAFLRAKCSENQPVLDELKHMKLNFSDDIEYYSSYYLIDSLLST